MKLSVKFIFVFSSIVLLMELVSLYGIYGFQSKILEQEITGKLENAAVADLDKLDRLFYERLSDLEVLGDNPVLLSKSSAPQIRSALELFLKTHPQYASVSYFDMNRMLIASTGISRKSMRRHPLSEYWPAIYRGEDHVVNISKSESLQQPTLHFADRVIDGSGKSVGIVVARIPVEELYDLMEGKIDVDGNSADYKLDVVDPEGTVLYSNHDKASILNAVDSDFEFIKDLIPSVRVVGSLTHAHQQVHTAEGHELMVFAKEQGYRSFKGNGWVLKIEYPSAYAFAPIAALGKKVSLMLLFSALIGIAAILFVLSFIVVEPIRQLNEAATRLGKGDLDARVMFYAPDEIGNLSRSFNAMALKLKEAREKLAGAAETALARASLAERKIVNISEETQQQIGQELHDDLGQHLTGIAFMAEVLGQHLKNQNHPAAEGAAKITDLVNEAIAKTHRLAHGLYPVEMKEAGLRSMLMRLAGNTESIYEIKCKLVCDGEPRVEAPLTTSHLFRITQEAVHNAVKHSGATRITLKLTTMPDATVIEVADNGRGIGIDLETAGGMGMHTMQYRAALLGATLKVNAASDGGTSVIVSLPVSRNQGATRT